MQEGSFGFSLGHIRYPIDERSTTLVWRRLHGAGKSIIQGFSVQGLDEGWRMRLQDVPRLLGVKDIITHKYISRTDLLFLRRVFCCKGAVQSVPLAAVKQVQVVNTTYPR